MAGGEVFRSYFWAVSKK